MPGASPPQSMSPLTPRRVPMGRRDALRLIKHTPLRGRVRPTSSEGDAAQAARSAPSRPVSVLLGIRDLPVLLVLGTIIGIVTIFHPNYVAVSSLINTARFGAYIGSMAIGMVFLLSMREIDLSVGAIYGLSAIVAARL